MIQVNQAPACHKYELDVGSDSRGCADDAARMQKELQLDFPQHCGKVKDVVVDRMNEGYNIRPKRAFRQEFQECNRPSVAFCGVTAKYSPV